MTNFISLSTLAWSTIMGSAHASTEPGFIPISKSDTTLTAKKTEDTDPWKLSGYVNLSQQSTNASKSFTSGVPRSVFDVHSSGNGDVGVTLANVPKKGWGGTVNVTAGDTADVIAAYNTDGTYNGSKKQFDVTQLFVQYAAQNVTFTAGKFVTNAGAEVIAAPANYNFSRGILFGYAIPFTHTGVRANYTPTSTVNLELGVVNGWDDIRDTNKSKTIEAQIGYTPNSTWNIVANGYFGKERLGGLINSGDEGNRNLIDIVGTYNFNAATSLVLNYDYGQQDNSSNFTVDGNNRAKWSGIAGYLHHSFTDKWSATVRYEYFDDTNGYRTGVIQKWSEGTLTVAYTPDATHEYRLEGRIDSSNKSSFVNTNFDGTKKTVNTIAGEFLWKF